MKTSNRLFLIVLLTVFYSVVFGLGLGFIGFEKTVLSGFVMVMVITNLNHNSNEKGNY